MGISPFFGAEAPSRQGSIRGDVGVGFSCDPHNAEHLTELTLAELERLQACNHSPNSILAKADLACCTESTMTVLWKFCCSQSTIAASNFRSLSVQSIWMTDLVGWKKKPLSIDEFLKHWQHALSGNCSCLCRLRAQQRMRLRLSSLWRLEGMRQPSRRTRFGTTWLSPPTNPGCTTR